ncbi:MAG: hypothetical protein ACJ71Q_19735 [Terriglobales bacterium]|jgi:hypothetical protein
MAAVQIFRGTGALPQDLEERFRRAYGRDMTEEERKFFGLKLEGQRGPRPAARDYVVMAA